jgi:hypothetical protein
MKKILLVLTLALVAQMTLAQRFYRTEGSPPPPGGIPTIYSFLPNAICTLTQQEITINGSGLNQVSSVLFTGATGVNLLGTITAQSDASLTVTTPVNIIDGIIRFLYSTGLVDYASIDTASILTINNCVEAPTASAQTFCGSATVSSLIATGTNIKWYDVANGGTALTSTMALATRTYYASQTINGQESSRTAVAVVVVEFPLPPPGLYTNYFCNSATVADLVEATEWFASQLGELF